MKTHPIPLNALTRVKLAYDALMLDDLPIDFDKVSELILAAGAVVRVVETVPLARPSRVVINGSLYIKL